MSHRSISLALITIASLTTAAPAATTTLDPGNSIQAAINSGLYTEIVLMPGNYNQTVDLAGAAITLRSTDPSDPAVVAATVVDGSFLNEAVIKCISSEGADTVIDGLTITGGVATDPAPGNRGGGIYINLASPTVRNCVFTGNEAGVGGAFYTNGGTPTFTNCRFASNTAGSGGVSYCNNGTVVISGCVFEGNTAVSDAGALMLYGGTHAISDSRFENNASTRFGGALNLVHTSTTTIERCSFSLNTCIDDDGDGRGGAIRTENSASVTATNCTFFDNECSQFGGALYEGSTGPMTMRHCSFVNNVAGSGEAVVATGGATFVNCICAGNFSPGAIVDVNTAMTYSNVEGGFAGVGNIDLAPMFVDQGSGDLRLLSGSPCIDAGSAAAILGEYPVDAAGDPRALDDPNTPDTGLALLGISTDMGAFEFQPEGGPDTCPADANGDGEVDVNDLTQVIIGWGLCP